MALVDNFLFRKVEMAMSHVEVSEWKNHLTRHFPSKCRHGRHPAGPTLIWSEMAAKAWLAGQTVQPLAFNVCSVPPFDSGTYKAVLVH